MTAPTRIKLWVTAQGKSEATRLQPVAQHPLGIPSLSRRGEVKKGYAVFWTWWHQRRAIAFTFWGI
ncbi:hypothetical protein [Parathermosynechococcus lividus]|uniref:hypothetical protein n=1 Tax=Parathermosynechococcus lividus TaxID=33070 RepID=UPI0018E0BB20|nr:hypothetical protein [Thermostichus lividus]